MIFALSDNKAIIGHGGDPIDLGVSLRVPPDWISTRGADWSDPAAVRAALLEDFADWSSELRSLIRDCDDTIAARQIFALPIGHRWERTPGVTLVGDAAHVMSPYAGEGANLALLDGAELALALVKHGSDIETALGEFEAAMFPAPPRRPSSPRPASKPASPPTRPAPSSNCSPAWACETFLIEGGRDGWMGSAGGAGRPAPDPGQSARLPARCAETGHPGHRGDGSDPVQRAGRRRLGRAAGQLRAVAATTRADVRAAGARARPDARSPPPAPVTGSKPPVSAAIRSGSPPTCTPR